MADWNSSPTLEAASRFRVSTGFTPFHATLLDICFGVMHPDPEQVQQLKDDTLSYADLDKLMYMVLVEFAASVEKEKKGFQEESHVKTQPNAYDVFVMKTTFGDRKSKISVVMPMKSGTLQWWDGDQGFASLDSDLHVYRIASLSGSARVLECLSGAKGEVGESLSGWAMRREMLVEVIEETDFQRAIESASLSPFARKRFGTTQPMIDPSIMASLNRSQQKAVLTVSGSSFREGFFAIQGPPGCGKTTTMVSMVSAIGQGMIVTAPSNAAVANLAIKLYKTNRFTFGDMCIFGDGCDESVQFLNPRLRSKEYTKALAQYQEIECKDSLAESAESIQLQERKKDEIRRKLAQWLQVDESLSIRELGQLCPYIEVDSASESVTRTGSISIARIMSNAKVLLCTLNSSGSSFFRKAVSCGSFDTLLVDEAGQCTEAEFFIATTFSGICRIIAMGDPKQLRPTVLEPACKTAGFGEAWLGRVFKLFPSKIHLLDTQYRMDPVILRFPNKRFYGQRIQSGENVLNRSPSVENPFRFIDTHGQGREERDEHFSFRNSYEVAVIKNMLRTDTDIASITSENSRARIIIITPYKAQTKLLREATAPLGSLNIEVSTVDAFQGQEGEVVILSSVRTRSVGFVDDSQRLNVGLTRAKRVLRVVGDRDFFETLPRGSTLRALSKYAVNSESIQVTKLRSIPTCPPDLSTTTQWKITLTQRFHNVIGSRERSEKYVMLNTLFALALPDLAALGSHVRQKEGWHTSWLKGFDNIRVIWVARNHDGTGIVEAHYAGNKDACLNFRQVNHVPPDGCSSPRADMCGVVGEDQAVPENGRLFVSWPLDDHLQHAIIFDNLKNLPLSMIQLDPPQERIARAPPPLLIESRSGTGKTLVLLQHAAFYHRVSDSRPACFVTVSPRLRNELEERYQELTPIHGAGLPETKFFSFRDFISGLLSHYNILEFEAKEKCTFQGYIMSRRSHEKTTIEAHLLENEIGGVIMGSVVAAQQCEPLTTAQYIMDKRSNIPNQTQEGREQRDLAYDEYERYSEWKTSAGKYDIHDAVLRILKETPKQLFASAYLDEVQDLSHAAIFLICRLAGKDSHYWVCGGDPAQMISPGCSFTFDGLKQTLRAHGCEPSELRQVEHLLVNYRTTKDILMLGNEILSTARTYFPGAIDFARPERARKDLGLKVAMISWDAAFGAKVKFGENQAFIFSTSNPGDLLQDANHWLDGHPFILSSLDSKGLEFDDVVVAFDHDRKIWQIERKLEASLSMLRELYVAVTRAQRRVVILVKEDTPSMIEFFDSLNCELERADQTIFQEFDCNTSAEEWYEKAQRLYRNNQFGLAANCFTRARRQDWSFLAQAQKLIEMGVTETAARDLRRAARVFYQNRDFKQILEILQTLLRLGGDSWECTDDVIFTTALEKLPKGIPREQVMRFAILREDFSSVLVSDLMTPNVGTKLMQYRQENWLKAIVATSSEEDRESIATSMPLVVVDYHVQRHDFQEACRVALLFGLYSEADNATTAFLNDTKLKWNPDKVVNFAETLVQLDARRVLSSPTPSVLLRTLFQSPKQIPASLRSECAKELGKDVILLAFDRSSLNRTDLLGFSTSMFKEEVESALVCQCDPNAIDVVMWYDRNGHPSLGSDFARERIDHWSNDDLFRIAINLWTRPKWLLQKLKERHLLNATLPLVLLSPFISDESKKQFWKNYLLFEGRKQIALEHVASKCRKDLQAVLTQMTVSGQLLEVVFAQMHLNCDTETKMRCSLKAVETYHLAGLNIAGLLRLWEEGKQHNGAEMPKITAATFEEKFSFLMCVFFGDEPTDARRNLYADNQDHFSSLLLAFGPTVAAYCKIHRSNKMRSQDDGLRQRLVAFHKELTSQVRKRHLLHAATPDLKGSEAASGVYAHDTASDSAEEQGGKPLSKKAARKQKQAARKKQAQNNGQVAQNSAAGKGKKKSQNKKKNNKKKRGRK